MNNNFQTFIMSNLLFILYLPNDQRVPRVMQLSYKFFPQPSFHTRNVTLFLGFGWKQNPLCLASSLHSHPKVNNHYSGVYVFNIHPMCMENNKYIYFLLLLIFFTHTEALRLWFLLFFTFLGAEANHSFFVVKSNY